MFIASAFRVMLRLIGIALVASFTPALLAQGSSPVADGYDPGVNGNVYTLALQPDGKAIIAGEFSWVQPNGATTSTPHNNIARLQPDGSNDATFTADVNGRIDAVVVQSDGKVVIGGRFTAVNGATRNRLARLNADGTLDAGFDPGATGGLTPDVRVLALQPDGKILVGGGFTKIGTTDRNRVARLNVDGSLDTTFNPDANGFVFAFAVQPDGRILIGGGFTKIGGADRARAARLLADGTVDPTFNPTANNAVSVIELLPNGDVIIAGSFTTLQPDATGDAISSNVTRIAMLDSGGYRKSGFLGYADGQVQAVKVQRDGSLLVAGTFSSIGDGSRAYLSRLLPDGTVDFSYAPTPNFTVSAIALQPDGSAVVGGLFTTMRGTGSNSIVRNHVARILANGALDATFRPDANGRLQGLAVQSDGKILVGGTFTSLGGSTRQGLARLNASGSVDTSFQAQVNGPVLAAAHHNGKIIIGGNFSRVGGTTRNNLARLNEDGTLDTTFDFLVDNQVNAIVVQSDGKILIGGAFSSIRETGETTSVVRSYIARVNTDGTLDETFTPSPSNAVHALALQSDGKIVLGGQFTSILPTGATSSSTRYGMARLLTDGKLDTTFDPNINGTILSVFVQGDGKVLAAGSFLQLAPNNSTTSTDRSNVARFNADGSLDTTFDPNPNDVVNTVVQLADKKIVLGGRFTTLRPNKTGAAVVRNYFARVNEDGSLDATYDLELDLLPGNQVIAAIPNANNQVLIGGAFTSLRSAGSSPVFRTRLARINADGSVDTAFDADTGATFGVPMEVVTVQSDGRVLAAGSFSSFGGTTSTNLSRFSLDSAPDTSFTPNIDGPVYAIGHQLTKGEPVSTTKLGFAWLQANGELRNFTLPSDLVLSTIRTVAIDPQGRVLIAGIMTIGSGTSSAIKTNLARFNSDGTVDSTFTLNNLDDDDSMDDTTAEIYAVHLQSDGKILVGGAFPSIGTVARGNVARLNADGALDTGFNLSTNGSVFDFAVQSDGKIIVAGQYSTIQSTSTSTSYVRGYIARVSSDGTVDAAFDPMTNAAVQSVLLRADGKILIGGQFTTLKPNSASATTDRTYAALLNTDGTLDTAVDYKVNGTVVDLQLQSDGKIILAGVFSSILDVTRNNIARINTDNTLDTAFNPNPNGAVTNVAIQADNRILISGSFSGLQPNSTTYDAAVATPRSRAARLNADGTVDPSFNPNFDSQVNGMVLAGDGTIVAWGSFSTLQPGGSLLVGGSFSTINAVSIKNLALFSRDGSVSSTFQPNPNGAVHAIVPLTNGQLVIGGAFTTVAGVDRNHLARFASDDTLDASFDPNVNGDVYAVALQGDGKLVIGGSFTTVHGVGRSNLARLNADGSLDTSFAPSVAGTVEAIALQPDGRILYTRAVNATSNVLARLNADGSADTSFNPANNNLVHAIAVQADGHIVVGGSFTSIGGGARSNFARLNANGALDTSLTVSPNGAVTALSIQSDGKFLIGGTFSSVDGLPRFGIARVSAPTAVTQSLSITANRGSIVWTRAGGAPEINGAIFETSTDNETWTSAGAATRIAGSSNWSLANPTLPSGDLIYVRARGLSLASPNSSTGVVITQAQFYLALLPTTNPPQFTSAAVIGGAAGSSFSFTLTASEQPTSYAATGLPAGLTLNSATGVISGTPTQSGTFTVNLTATNSAGSGTSSLLLIISPAGQPSLGDSKLVNVSINGQVTAAEPIIAGFVIKGTTPQTVLLRAVGPTLGDVGVNNFLAAPHLKLLTASAQLIGENTSWGDSAALSAEFVRLGAGPLKAGSKDAALLVTLNPGVYMIHVASADGASGYAIAEVYDASADTTVSLPRLVNLSGRALVNTSGDIITGGFVISGKSARRVLVRGVGPDLENVANKLGDPSLALYKSGVLIAGNDNWEAPVTINSSYPAVTGPQIAAAATAAGAGSFEAGSKDAAIVVTLAPGVYTAQVGRVGNSDGSGLVEIYELDLP